jgi:hypothetical protein
MKTKLFILIAICYIAVNTCYSQSVLTTLKEWQKETALLHTFAYKNVYKTDTAKNIYIAGATINSNGNYDILLIKYDDKGVPQWTQQYDGGGNDVATAIILDSIGNIYLTGSTTNTNADIITFKFANNGSQTWIKTFNGNANLDDYATDITLGEGYSIFISGTSFNSNNNTDITLVKYANDGDLNWAAYFNSSFELNDIAFKLQTVEGSVYISSTIQTFPNKYNYAIVRFNAYDGGFTSVTYNSSGNIGIDKVTDATKDKFGNLYLTGAKLNNNANYDYYVVKLDSNLVQQWERTYNGADNLEDYANAVKVDNSGNVYITGYSTSIPQGKNFVTIKYNSSGTLQWTSIYNNPDNTDDIATAMTLDNLGKLYVTGSTHNAQFNNDDFYTIRYNATTGANTGAIAWDSKNHYNDTPTNILLDSQNNIIVGGMSQAKPTEWQYVTVKYSERDILKPAEYLNDSINPSFSYYENKGQIITTDTTNTDAGFVRFYTNNTYPQLYFQDNNYSMVFASIDTIAATPDTLHRIDVSFEGAYKVHNNKIYSIDEKKEGYLNYFLSQCPDGITAVMPNERLVVPEIYDKIDLQYYSNQKGFKYAFVIKEGGDPTKISHKFTGATSANIDANGTLQISSSIGSIGLQCHAYQVDNSNNIITLPWNILWNQVQTNFFSFDLGAYDASKTLVIVVDRLGNNSAQASHYPVWGTYFGGGGFDMANDITSDNLNNIYSIGETTSTNIPVSPGPITFQQNNKGARDAFIVSFNDNYSKRWCTYFGGNGGDYGYGIAYSSFDDKIYICGTTSSNATTFPTYSASATSYANTAITGSYDGGFIARFKTTGSREWLTPWGGSNTFCNKIKCDQNGNVYVVGNTSKTNINYSCSTYNSDFQVCNPQNGAYVQAYNSSGIPSLFLYDGFIAKFNEQTELVWSTLLGGDGDDWLSNLDIDNVNQKLYVVGSTSSTGTVTCSPIYGKFPICNAGGTYIQSTLNQGYQTGFNDAIISKFTLDGRIEWSTFIGGNKDESATGVKVNSNGDVFVAGITSTPTYGATNCASPSNGGFPKCMNGYSQNFASPASGGNFYDDFIMKFNSSGGITWSTFIGGGADEGDSYGLVGGPKLTIDSNNNLYLYSTTASGSSNTNTAIPILNNNSFFNESAHSDNIGTSLTCTDTYIFGFNNTNTHIYSSYYGGRGFLAQTNPHEGDFNGGIVATNNGSLFICGGTYSSSLLPLYCPTTTNPYCQGNSTVTAQFSDAFFANILQGPVNSVSQYSESSLAFNIYPNPTSDQINIDFFATFSGDITIDIYNIMGEKVNSKTSKTTLGKNMQTINFTNLASWRFRTN